MRHLPLSLCALLLTSACGEAPPSQNETERVFDPALTPQRSGSGQRFIAISIVNRDTVWVSGTGGTFARTTDGGAMWHADLVAGADSLQFRDIFALDGSTAWLLSIGNGDQSRIYHTTDAGSTWTLQFTNAEPDGFFDCFDFWDANNGIAFSDSFDGSFYIIRTTDGGNTWTRVPIDRLPPAAEGEGGFASSGTCLVTGTDSSAWIGTGNTAAGARVLRTTDRGSTWSAAPAPVFAGEAAGIATLAFNDSALGSAIGGDIGRPDTSTENTAISTDGGRTWTAATRTPFSGAVYGSTWVPGTAEPTLVVVGPHGMAFSVDRATTWTVLDSLEYWAVDFAAPDAGWAVGPRGRITRIQLFRPTRPGPS